MTERLGAIVGPWSIGVHESDDGSVSIYRVNTGVKDLGPSSGYDTLVSAKYPFQETDNAGMPSPSTAGALSELQDRITDQLRSSAEAVFVAAKTTADHGRTFYFYTNRPEKLIQVVRDATTPYAAEPQFAPPRDDPEWTSYREILEGALAGEADIHIVKRLQSLGLDPSLSSEIEHFLFFPSQELAVRAKEEWLQPVQIRGPVELEDGQWCLIVQARHTTQFAELASWRRQLKLACDEFSGFYDGWAIPVDTPDGRQWFRQSWSGR